MAEASVEITMSAKDQQICYDYLMTHIGEIMRQVRESTVRQAYNKVKSICKDAVDAFYSEGNTNEGGRTGDLYNAYDIGISDGQYLSLELGPDLMDGKHHQGAEFVYENSFVRGYHGGSAGTDRNDETVDTPHFRVPGGKWTYWGEPAPRSSSIRNRIVGRCKIYNEKTLIPLQMKEFEKLLIQVRERLGV